MSTASFDPLERFQVLYEDADFTLGVSHHQIDGHERVHVHVDVRRFAPAVLRTMDRVFPAERAKLPTMIGAILNHTVRVGPHFMRRYGWIPCGQVPWPGSDEMHAFWVNIRRDGG